MLENRNTIILYCVIFVVGIALGAWASYSWFVPGLREDASKYKLLSEYMAKQPLPIQEKIETKTVTQIEYVDKVIDPATGKQEETDVELNTDTPKIGVKVNGQPWAFGLREGEQYKFQNGKLVMEQTSTADINIDVRPMVAALAAEETARAIKKYDKPNGTGVLYSSDGWQAMQIRRLSPSWEVAAEVTLPDPGKHIGAGLIYRY